MSEGSFAWFRRPSALAAVFWALFLLCAALFWIQLAWTGCYGTDAAGCGMSRGLGALTVYAAAGFTGVLGLLFLIPRRPVRVTALLLLAPVTIISLAGAGRTVEENLRQRGSLTGRSEADAPPTDEQRLRRAIGCVLATTRENPADPSSKQDMAEMAAFFAGQVWVLSADMDDAQVQAMARGEAGPLADPAKAAARRATCADLEMSRRTLMGRLTGAAAR